ncbi:MAG: methyltransferase [Bacteroidales bacterium]|jgi:tRNA1Val (adenine37-N6)-methyltransferase
MKVNTDGVLLGAWLSLPSVGSFRVLDIGTGTGVIALIVAQRLSKLFSTSSKDQFSIDAIDIDKPSVDEANYNFSQSPWTSHLSAKEVSLQDLLSANTQMKYDLVVSNPPYFTDSLKAPSARRSSARHNHDLPYSSIIESVIQMLTDKGKLAIVLPAEEGERFITLATMGYLQLVRRCKVKTLADKKEKRYLLEFTKSPLSDNVQEEVLIMQQTGGLEYTEQYKNLTRDLYLKF